MSAKRKLAMSGVAILVVLTLIAGATMAWFTDTEKVNANFTAGVLDISIKNADGEVATELNFQNMRPMENDTFVDEATAVLNGENPYEGEGYDPTPVYVQQFAISNEGTLPVNLKLSFEDATPTLDVPEIVSNGNGGIRKGENTTRQSQNELGKDYTKDKAYVENAADGDDIYAPSNYDNTKVNPHFHVVLFQKVEGTWKVVAENISLDTLKDEDGYVLMNGNQKLVLPAGATAEDNTYALGAYLDEGAGNEYQGKAYEVNFTVNAKQTDEGATFAK